MTPLENGAHPENGRDTVTSRPQVGPVAVHAVGTEAPVVVHRLTLLDLVRYSGASGDAFPIHHDAEAAHAAGLPGVIGHGMFSAGVLSRAVTDFVGVEHLRRFAIRFVGMTEIDQVLTTRVRVVEREARDDGTVALRLDCLLVDHHGDVKVTADAWAVVPAEVA